MSLELSNKHGPEGLAAIAGDFHARGWMSGTAGNLSCRCEGDDGAFWITASGRSKGRLKAQDFLLVGIKDGKVLESRAAENRPSAETAIHRVIYDLFPEARACFHVHSVDAALVSDWAPAQLPMPALEMLKGLGIWEENPRVSLPVFANWLDVGAIAECIAEQFRQHRPGLPALLIRHHGITVWADSLEQCFNRVEIAEFILAYLARRGPEA